MSTTSRPRLKAQAVLDRCHVDIVELAGTYVRNARSKSAAILDGTELCRVEDFAARHFRDNSGTPTVPIVSRKLFSSSSSTTGKRLSH